MRRFSVPKDLKHRYRIFPPAGQHKWRIMRYENGKFRTVTLPEIHAINHMGLLYEETKDQLNLLVERLYRQDGVQISRVASNTHNENILQKYLAELPVSKNRPGSYSAKINYLRAALSAIGEHSVSTSDIKILQEAIDHTYKDQRQRRAAGSLNSLLKYLGRKERIVKVSHIPPSVRYLPGGKLSAMLDKLPSPAWRLLVEMAFNTGMRIGELMALERQNKKRFAINVDWQIDRDGVKCLPKNGKRRSAVPFQRAFEIFDDWIEAKDHIPPKSRARASRVVKKACHEAFPNKPDWHLRFHDLRHSYAVAALENGLSLEEIAKQLGNSIEVTEEHYVGFVQSTRMEETVFKVLNPISDE